MNAPFTTSPNAPLSHPLYRAVGDLLRAVEREKDMERSRACLDQLLTLLASLGVTPTPSLHVGLRAASASRFGVTSREFDILRAIAEGGTYAEIGRRLFISEDTVKTHTRHIYAKLGARDRPHAVAIAFREALLT